jgi:CheY-like chemotaxis protein
MGRRNLDDPLIEAMRQTIDRQSLSLTRIVDELLDVNRVARGQFIIDKQTIDMREVLARAIESSRPLIDAHGHSLHVAIADLPIVCVGDPMRLAQVFINILNNAAKYTPDGGDIWLSTETTDDRVAIRIRDNGRGIERDAIDRVFDLFMQIDPTAGSALGGLGVGLALVRRIVELHGGSVQAISDGLGRGSEFVVRLPVGESLRLDPSGDAAPLIPDQAPPLRVLVIDDNKDAADSFCMLMKAMGHEVRAAYNGPSGIVLAQEFDPDVVMLDIGMPGMSGYQVARALRADSITHVLVAVTGWGDEAAKRQARESGFDHHLVKPVSESVLIKLLADISKNRSATR